MKARFAIAAAALAGALAVSATAANATTIVYNFNSPSGDLGPTETYTVSGRSITASAFGPSSGGVADHLYGKNLGGDENGLGMTNDPSGQHEIYFGMGFVQLDVSSLTGDLLNLAFNSTTGWEQWTVYGTNTAGTLGSATLPVTKTFIGSGNTETTLSFTDSFKYYDILSTSTLGGKNVLITSLTASVPEPATWGLMIVGMGVVGAALRGRRRNVIGGALA